MGSTGYARLKEKSGISSHFMMVGKNIWLPFLILSNTALTLWVLYKHPISIQIKPIMVCSASWPDFIKFSGLGVGNKCFGALVYICPISKTIKPIRINVRVY